MSDIVKLYNPANSAALTNEQIEGLQSLTNDQIKELGAAYPNSAMQRAYLLIIDSSKPLEKQLPNLSTFENLWNLRVKNGLTKFVAYNFKGNYKPKNIASIPAKRTQIVDLSDTELLSLPGFKSKDAVVEPQEVKVTKVVKTTQQ